MANAGHKKPTIKRTHKIIQFPSGGAMKGFLSRLTEQSRKEVEFIGKNKIRIPINYITLPRSA